MSDIIWKAYRKEQLLRYSGRRISLLQFCPTVSQMCLILKCWLQHALTRVPFLQVIIMESRVYEGVSVPRPKARISRNGVSVQMCSLSLYKHRPGIDNSSLESHRRNVAARSHC